MKYTLASQTDAAYSGTPPEIREGSCVQVKVLHAKASELQAKGDLPEANLRGFQKGFDLRASRGKTGFSEEHHTSPQYEKEKLMKQWSRNHYGDPGD